MTDALLRLEMDKAKHLFERCTESTNAPKINGYSCEDCRAIGEAIRAALDSPPVEERCEWRVAYEVGGRTYHRPGHRFLSSAQTEARIAGGFADHTNVRIQHRTTTQLSDGSTLISPWTDLTSEEGQGGE